jgi:hypothetical protein
MKNSYQRTCPALLLSDFATVRSATQAFLPIRNRLMNDMPYIPLLTIRTVETSLLLKEQHNEKEQRNTPNCVSFRNESPALVI